MVLIKVLRHGRGGYAAAARLGLLPQPQFVTQLLTPDLGNGCNKPYRSIWLGKVG